MIIEQSMIAMSAEHQKTESVSYIRRDNLSDFGQNFTQAQSLLDGLDIPEVAAGGKEADESQQAASILIMTDQGLQFREGEVDENAELQQSYTQARLFKALFEAITGKEIPVVDDTFSGSEELAVGDYASGRVQNSEATAFLSEEKTLQVTVHISESIEEYESTRFSAAGIVKTSDGAEININLDMAMERKYSATREVSFTQEVRFKDPLLLNFNGTAAELSDESFEFDIDADGEMESLSYLEGASGWLGLDKNDNGRIDDGSELFGGLTGRGFDELRQYDSDENGFIDAGDDIFNDLLVWNKTLESDELLSLQESNVGAIYTGSEKTPFDIKNENNQTLGRVIESGFYIAETGEVGTVQQIDMAV
ncbi:hypothetical protein [Neptunomonas japonica]|uniref:hypothetical protein n=1 Tax=Neptunomonas japonica TaxID=417574 RepID=UPI0003F850BB|nr:hypothetical protein [Neptunomonas japonica]